MPSPSASTAPLHIPNSTVGPCRPAPGPTTPRLGQLWPLAARWRSAALLAIHGAVFAAVYLLSFAVRFDAVPRAAWATALASLPLVIEAKLVAVLATRGHRGWWQDATFADMAHLARTATLASVGTVLAALLAWGEFPIPRTVILIDWAGTLLVLCGARAATRIARDIIGGWAPDPGARRVLVVGADKAGEALAHVMPRRGMKILGFLDPNPDTHGRTLASLPVLGGPENVRAIALRHRAETVFVPTPAVPARVIRGLVAACEGTNVRVQVVPRLDALLSGDLTVQPRDVDIRDLLCREPVRLDTHALGAFLGGRSVLVSGAAGSIGREICRQVLAFGPARLVLLDHSENGLFYFDRELKDRATALGCELIPCVASIADAGRLDAAFAEHRPEVVFHAAAHKHVPMMESNPGEAVKNNVFGTRTLVETALSHEVKAFVMISTDKAVNPTSVMGACKRLAEMVVQSLSGLTTTRLVTVRFGNVLGSTGSVVPIFQEQIRNGGPITVTHPEMTRYFMTIPEAAQLVLQAGAQGEGGEIFVLDMGEPVKVVDLARDMIRLSGMKEGREVEIAITGLRPGEKLFEELYDEAELCLPTSHPQIFRARPRPCDSQQLWRNLDGLSRLVDKPAAEVIDGLMALLPEYKPNPKVPTSGRSARTAAPFPSHHTGAEPTDDGRRMPEGLAMAALG